MSATTAAPLEAGPCRTFTWCQIDHLKQGSWEELEDGRIECEHVLDTREAVVTKEGRSVNLWLAVFEYRDSLGQSFSAPRLVLDTNGVPAHLAPLTAVRLARAIAQLEDVAGAALDSVVVTIGAAS
ncbi:hypothetical protein FB562_1885 [Homoserinimonas aerilata]|uniref:Uncharacterized protein n=1 Tax=Homoserinimonas aerilata TaxID=1162970 RepID=A0A542YL09_9MICO|nr:hypothetical protein [Homoserinimonas aerilata]TQL48779.1 hypothetical protein FB562_1885 [Homoserinimonas aerilata]